MTENIIIAIIGFLGSVVCAFVSGFFASRSKGHKEECEKIKTEIKNINTNNQNQQNKVIVNNSTDIEKVKELENKIAEFEKQFKDISKNPKKESEAEFKKKWDNLDSIEKERLKPFKKINSIGISFNDINNAVYSGLRKKGILIPTQEISWINETTPCIVAPEYIEFLKDL
jgi:gas vesicle protein